MRYAPFLFGLAGCLLPHTRYSVGGESYSSRISGEYAGWSVMVILLFFAAISFYNLRHKRPDPPFLFALAGIYVTGFALFRAWHTFTLFSGNHSENLANRIGAGAIPGEGLVLLTLSGAWILVNAIKSRKQTFSTPVE